MSDNIYFSPEKVADLQDKYDEAVAAGEDSFTFEGKPMLVSYAKYLLEYLKTIFT